MNFDVTGIISVVLVLITGGVCFTFWKKFKRQKGTESIVGTSTLPVTEVRVRFREVVEATISLNRSIRLELAFTEAHVALIESIIDDGLEILTLMYEQQPLHESSSEVCKIFLDRLPEYVEAYMRLPQNLREQNGLSFLDGLNLMKGELKKIRRILDDRIMMNYKILHEMNNLEFGGTTDDCSDDFPSIDLVGKNHHQVSTSNKEGIHQ